MNEDSPRSLMQIIKDKDKEIWELKKEIDRLNEELQLIEIIERDHKELNGNLRAEVAKFKIVNKKLEDKILEFVRPTKRSIDDL